MCIRDSLHSVLYYSKNAEELQPDFIDQMLGCSLPLTAEGQKETFNTIISDTLGEECDYEVIRTCLLYTSRCV